MYARGLTAHRLHEVTWRESAPQPDTLSVRAQQIGVLGLMVGAIGLALNLAADQSIRSKEGVCPPCNCNCGGTTGDADLTQVPYDPSA